MDTERTIKNLEKNGFAVRYFETAEAAAEYLLSQLHGRTVGIGGSVTIEQLALYDRLCADNTVYWHGVCNTEETKKCAAQAQAYLTSANAIAETGEIVNIDGAGNRVASMLYGHETLYIVSGVNKLAPDLHAAIDRARNVAAPRNARRLGRKTPCALPRLRKPGAHLPRPLRAGAAGLRHWPDRGHPDRTDARILTKAHQKDCLASEKLPESV